MIVVMNAWKVMKVDESIMNMLAHCMIMGFVLLSNAILHKFWECSHAQCAWELHTRNCVHTCLWCDNSFAGYPNVMQTLPRGWG
jgi:hypothetical protein